MIIEIKSVCLPVYTLVQCLDKFINNTKLGRHVTSFNCLSVSPSKFWFKPIHRKKKNQIFLFKCFVFCFFVFFIIMVNCYLKPKSLVNLFNYNSQSISFIIAFKTRQSNKQKKNHQQLVN